MPSRRAFEVRLPASEPVPGSVRPKQPSEVPLAIRGQPLLLLLLGAEAQHGLAEQPVRDRHDPAQRGVCAAELLHAEHVGQVVATEAAVLLGDGEPEEPDLRHLRDDREVDLLVAVPLGAVRHRLAVEEVPREVAERPLLVVQAQVHGLILPWCGQVDEYGERGPMCLGGAEQQRVGLGPLEVQVRRVLPGHADAAVQLDRLLGGVHGDLRAERRGHRDRDRCVGVVGGERRGGVPRGGVGLLDLGVQVGEPVLEGLEPADDAAELPALLEVGDRGLERPAGDADLLGGEQPGAHLQSGVDRGGRRPRTRSVRSAPSRSTDASGRVMSSEETGVTVAPRTAYSASPSGRSSTSAGRPTVVRAGWRPWSASTSSAAVCSPDASDGRIVVSPRATSTVSRRPTT